MSPNRMNSANIVGNVMKEWTAKFEKANILEPAKSIQNIMAHVMNNSKVKEMLKQQDSELSEAQISSLNKLCECRLARMPVEYIIKEWDFRDLTLKMVPPVFIPRPETEELIDIITNKFATPPSGMIEIGSGTGAISIALLKHFPGLKGIAIDQAKHACDLTHENAVAHGVSNNLQIINTEIDNKGQIKNFPTELLKEKFELIVSNPPYISSPEIPKLRPEITLYEDLKALDGGHDGLHVIKSICVFGSNHLKPDGSIFLEINDDHLEQIKEWLDICKGHNMNIKLEESYKDFNDINRFVQLKLIK